MLKMLKMPLSHFWTVKIHHLDSRHACIEKAIRTLSVGLFHAEIGPLQHRRRLGGPGEPVSRWREDVRGITARVSSDTRNCPRTTRTIAPGDWDGGGVALAADGRKVCSTH